jgi:16S rRNA C967 or C1407 C5-methylase (RsmB/RsmF family)
VFLATLLVMAEPVDDDDDERDLRIKWLERQIGELHGTLHFMEAKVDGLEYELRVRDIRIEELTKENALLRKRLEEQKPSPPPPGVVGQAVSAAFRCSAGASQEAWSQGRARTGAASAPEEDRQAGEGAAAAG